MQTQLDGMGAASRADRPRRHGGRPRVSGSRVTSVEITPRERELLERIAAAEGDISLGEVWRRSLHFYAEHHPGRAVDAQRKEATAV